jgi:hypothetical protein
MPGDPELLMKSERYIAALLVAFSLTPLAMAQSGVNVPATEPYVPRLGDIMNAIQQRHMKLWFAGKARNWELATYELRQLESGLMEAATLYSGIPATNVTRTTEPAKSVADAIEAKDSRRFAKAVSEFTDGCNACDQSIGRGFIICECRLNRPSVISLSAAGQAIDAARLFSQRRPSMAGAADGSST